MSAARGPRGRGARAAELALELAPRGRPDRLDHPAAAPDHDPLLGLRLDPQQRAHGEQVAALLDLLDLDLDRVRDLLARAGEHLLAHELGEHAPLRLVGDLLGREVERALGQQRGEVVDQRRHPVAGARRDREDLGVEPSSAAAGSAATVRAWLSRSTLLTAITTGTRALPSASAIHRSPGPPTPWSPLTTNSAASASRQLRLDAALHPPRQLVARALHARAGR